MGWTHLCSSFSKRREDPSQKVTTSKSSRLIILAYIRLTSIMISSVRRNKDEGFMACKKKNFKQQKKREILPSVRVLVRDLLTRAHVEDKVKKCSAGAQKDEKCKYSYDKEKQRLLQEKPAWFTRCIQLMSQKVWPALKQEVTARSCKLIFPIWASNVGRTWKMCSEHAQ